MPAGAFRSTPTQTSGGAYDNMIQRQRDGGGPFFATIATLMRPMKGECGGEYLLGEKQILLDSTAKEERRRRRAEKATRFVYISLDGWDWSNKKRTRNLTTLTNI